MTYLIAIEGLDGAGKNTVSEELAKEFSTKGLRSTVVSFPRYGHTVGGWNLGAYLAGDMPRHVGPRALATLYAMDRMESLDFIKQVASEHQVIIFDRYIGSNIAYQSSKVASEDVDTFSDWIWRLETTTFGLPSPNFSVFLDTPRDVARRLIAKKNKRSYTDKIYDAHEQDEMLQTNVRHRYLRLSEQSNFGRWITVSTVNEHYELKAPPLIAREIYAQLISAGILEMDRELH